MRKAALIPALLLAAAALPAALHAAPEAPAATAADPEMAKVLADPRRDGDRGPRPRWWRRLKRLPSSASSRA